MSYRVTFCCVLLAALAVACTATAAGRLLFEMHPHEALGWGVFAAVMQPWYLLFFPQVARRRRRLTSR